LVSQEGLALLTEIDRSYMGSIERGEQNIGVMHLVRIAHALDMTVSELVMDAEL
jgi:transcriptional regulator with XRE-family HTH domain